MEALWNEIHTVCNNDSTWEARNIVYVESAPLIEDISPKSIVVDHSRKNNIVPLLLKYNTYVKYLKMKCDLQVLLFCFLAFNGPFNDNIIASYIINCAKNSSGTVLSIRMN